MTWTITYRNQQGAAQVLELEGENRGVIFSELRQRGITPLNVIEGARPEHNKKNKRKPQKKTRSFLDRIVTVLAIIILAAVIAVFLWSALPGDVRSSAREKARPAGKISIRVSE